MCNEQNHDMINVEIILEILDLFFFKIPNTHPGRCYRNIIGDVFWKIQFGIE